MEEVFFDEVSVFDLSGVGLFWVMLDVVGDGVVVL